MKKILFVLVMTLLMTFMWGCSMDLDAMKKLPNINGDNMQNKYKASLYFTDKDSSKILSETREIIVEDEKDLPELIVKELLKGPVNIEMKKAIPDKTKLIGIKLSGTVAEVNFSKEYYNTGDIGEVVTRFSVVNTLCDLPNINKVKIFVEGKELVGPSGNPFGALGKDDVVCEESIAENDKINLKLYFQNNEGTILISEKRTVTLKDNQVVEKYIVQELIKGPENKDLSKTIPAETKLISVETKDNVCFVNLSQEFKTKHNGGSWGETSTIYSIVNSLTELPHIEQVQFLIEGKIAEEYKGHIIFNEPFTRNEDMFKK